MNHLAHAFLSFGNEDLLIGNFIGDFIKGKDWQHYPEGIQRGILLHREIDAFTDFHRATEKSKARVRAYAARYASPVTDVLYDYLLVKNWELYTDQTFADFSTKVYKSLESRAAIMPEILQRRLPIMLAGQFLKSYTTEEGMRFVMSRFGSRLPMQLDLQGLLVYFFAEIDAFSEDFNAFFPELIEDVLSKFPPG